MDVVDMIAAVGYQSLGLFLDSVFWGIWYKSCLGAWGVEFHIKDGISLEPKRMDASSFVEMAQ